MWSFRVKGYEGQFLSGLNERKQGFGNDVVKLLRLSVLVNVYNWLCRSEIFSLVFFVREVDREIERKMWGGVGKQRERW